MLSTSVVQFTDEVCNGMVTAIKTAVDGGTGAGTLTIYAGDVPATAATAITTQTPLGTLTFSDPSFGTATARVLTASAISDDTSADASGTISFGRICDSAGTTICDVRAGIAGSFSGGNPGLVCSAATTVAGQVIQVVSLTFTQASGA